MANKVRRWGERERLTFTILPRSVHIICACGKAGHLPRPGFERGDVETMKCECGREHRVKLVVQSRGANEEGGSPKA